jgi:lysozyme
MTTRLLAGDLQLSLPVACHFRAATRGTGFMPLVDPRTYPFIATHEGKVLRAYHDAVRVVTIGYGFTMGSTIFAAYWRAKHGRGLRLGDTISLAEANMLLKQLIDREYVGPVERGAPNATPHAKGGATSLMFNAGLGAAKWKWFQALAKGDVPRAAAYMRVTATTARGRRLPGLVRRRQEEANILEDNRWPSWVKVPANLDVGGMEAAMPEQALQDDDFKQGIEWLEELGFLAKIKRSPATQPITTGPYDLDRLTIGIKSFQSQHKQLTVDGIMGRATLTQLQRVIDLKRKAGQVAVPSGTAVAAGGGDAALNGASYHGDLVMIGGVVFAFVGLGILAWLYRDELKIALSRGKA